MRHQRARVARLCQYPDTAWWRLAAFAPRSETLLSLCRIPDKDNYADAAVMPMFAARGGSAAGQGGALAA